MAKKGEHRILIAFVCTVCKGQNYISEKNKLNETEKLVLKKYCKRCKKQYNNIQSTIDARTKIWKVYQIMKNKKLKKIGVYRDAGWIQYFYCLECI